MLYLCVYLGKTGNKYDCMKLYRDKKKYFYSQKYLLTLNVPVSRDSSARVGY